MLRALIASFSFSFLLLLTACGGDGGGSAGSTAPPGPSVISSVAVKGVIDNGLVKLQRWQSGAYKTVASARTSADGSFSFPGFTPVPGEVLKLTLSTASGAKMICDATQCGSADFGEVVTLGADLGLSSWVSVDAAGAVTVMPITPVSTLLVDFAEKLGGGHFTASGLQVARSLIAGIFRLQEDELLAVPGNIASAPWVGAADDGQLKIALLSAAFAELAGGDAAQIATVVKDYSQAFLDNNGALLEQDAESAQTIARIFGAVDHVVALITLEAVQDKALAWTEGVISMLREGKLSSVCQGDVCSQPFDSGRFVTALGAMGGDVTDVLHNNGYNSLEEALAGELNKFGWLASADTIALVGVATQTIAYSGEVMFNRYASALFAQMIGLPPVGAEFSTVTLEPINGLTPTVTGAVLNIAGQQNGLDVNLNVTLPNLYLALHGNKKLSFGLTGTVANERVSGVVDATLVVDAADTNFAPLLSLLTLENMNALFGDNPEASQVVLKKLMGAVGTLAQKAKFKVDIAAEKFRFQKVPENEGDVVSMLAIEGQGQVRVDMAGGSADKRIKLAGEVNYGRVTLPNGFWFEVGEGESLSFAMDKDGSFAAMFSANALALFKGDAEGTLKNMGVLVSNLRDSIVSQMTSTSPDVSGMLGQLLDDVSSLDLLITADMLLVDKQHLYKLRIANAELSITQPDSSDIAMRVSLGTQGLVVAAGTAWWIFMPDLSDLSYPAVRISDDTGGQWVYSINLGGLIAGL
ncbi:MAG: hypothetical protein ACRERR_10620 [Moraxellaceae bacterium]